jgi:hypothetical protein
MNLFLRISICLTGLVLLGTAIYLVVNDNDRDIETITELELIGEPRLIDSWGNGSPNLEINLPMEWVYSKHKGPDFDVHYFNAPDESGAFSIYIGHHPGLILQELVVKSKHCIGNKKVVFQQGKRQGRTLTEALVDDFYNGQEGAGVSELMLHIMITENKTGFTDTVFGYLKTLRMQK